MLQQGKDALRRLEYISTIPMISRDQWQVTRPEGDLLQTALSPEDERDLTALVMHTSGSTGMPKV